MYILKRAPHLSMQQIALLYVLMSSNVEIQLAAKEPYISAKEPYISAKEPHIATKTPCVHLQKSRIHLPKSLIAKEPNTFAKEPNTSTKKPNISAEEPYMYSEKSPICACATDQPWTRARKRVTIDNMIRISAFHNSVLFVF